MNGKKVFPFTVKLLLSKQENLPTLTYGDVVIAKGEIKGLSQARNNGGFDQKQYGKIQANLGSLQASTAQIKVLKNEKSIGQMIFQIRTSLKEKIRQILPEETSGILIGFLIGEKNNIDKETIEYFRDSSLIHMLCVSGSHVSYIAIGIQAVFLKLCDRKKAIHVICMIGICFFMGITGFSPSIARACIMGILMQVSKLVGKQSDITTSICFSFTVLLLINPFYLLDIGLLLSYAGTIGIVAFDKMGKQIMKLDKAKPIKRAILETLWVCFSAQIMVMPITLYFFNSVNITFFLANLAATFLFTVIMFGGIIVLVISYLCMPLAIMLGEVLHISLRLFEAIATFFARLPFSNFTVATPNIEMIVRLLFYYYIRIMV